MSRVLLVSPAFHGYWKAIETALQARGHEVHVHLYDEHPTLRSRVVYKFRHELPQRLGRGDAALESATTTRAINVTRQVAPEAVLVVKGDLLGDDFYDSISGLPRVLWLYDELRRTRWATRNLKVAGPICSYSPLDTRNLVASGLNATHLPLAFDHRIAPTPTIERNSDVVFIGARYPKREATLLGLAESGVQVRAYGRDWSHHVLDRLRTWNLRRPDLPAGRDLSRADAYNSMTAGLATLNIHGDQDGFTMRTFEACGVGALQFIDRRDVSELYDDGVELASYGSKEELLALCQRAALDPAWAKSVREAGRRRTLTEHTFDHRVALLAGTWG